MGYGLKFGAVGGANKKYLYKNGVFFVPYQKQNLVTLNSDHIIIDSVLYATTNLVLDYPTNKKMFVSYELINVYSSGSTTNGQVGLFRIDKYALSDYSYTVRNWTLAQLDVDKGLRMSCENSSENGYPLIAVINTAKIKITEIWVE